jgi:hypothetical protein
VDYKNVDGDAAWPFLKIKYVKAEVKI